MATNPGQIPSTPADGNFKVVVVPTIADVDNPTAAELSAASAVDISCYLTAAGFTPGIEQETIADDRLCGLKLELPGTTKHNLDIEYIDNTNSPYEAEHNKAKETLADGSTGFIVTRGGLPWDQGLASGETVRIYPYRAGAYQPQPPEANSVLKIQQKIFITGAVAESQVAAGA